MERHVRSNGELCNKCVIRETTPQVFLQEYQVPNTVLCKLIINVFQRTEIKPVTS